MAIPKIIGAQRDFSAGEVDVSMKRADESPAMKAGARQCSNLRILNSRAVQNRPGRRALFLEGGRVEEILMSPGNLFYIALGTAYLRIYNAAGTKVFDTNVKGDGVSLLQWTANTVNAIVYDVFQLSIIITYADGFPLNVPQVLTWDGVSQTSTWTLTTFAESLNGNQKRTLFYRISPVGVTLLPAAQTGANVLVTASAPIFKPGMVGTRLRFVNRQMLIISYTDPTHVQVTIEESLPGAQTLTFGVDPTATFNVGDVIEGSVTGSTGVVIVMDAVAKTVAVQLLQTTTTAGISYITGAPVAIAFSTTDTVVGPGGGLVPTSVSPVTAPAPVSIWDDEVMNPFRGYPTSCFVDQGRLGFCNFSVAPSGIGWSAIGTLSDFYVGALPSQAIFELAPRKSQVLYVVAGMEGSELIFCDNAVYYIPITPASPLEPGSVAFNQLSLQGSAAVQPRSAEQSIIYIKSGGTQVGAVQVPGAYNRPYVVDNISELHAHLFKSPIAIAIPSGSTQFEETYLYVLNADGTLAVGKYVMKGGLLETGPEGKPHVGWVPWLGAGTAKWVAALGTDTIFVSTYAPNGIAPISVVEVMDNTQYLDAAISVNNLPAPFTPTGGKGPLYVFPGPNSSVTLMDQSTRMMGTYKVDANGNIIPQGNAGENLAIASLVAGQPWTATLEPFVPDANPGQSVHQRMFKRRVSRMAVYVSSSTGFLMARLFSGPLTRTSPALGTVMNQRRITAWNQDDDPTKPPPLREEAQRNRPIGRSFDPRVAVIKDTPGPLVIHEIGLESSI